MSALDQVIAATLRARVSVTIEHNSKGTARTWIVSSTEPLTVPSLKTAVNLFIALSEIDIEHDPIHVSILRGYLTIAGGK